MFQVLRCTIEGVSPLLMHSAALADPANDYATAIREITSKHHSKKTDADALELRRLEFLGGLYYREDLGVYVPGQVVEGVIRDAAKTNRKGKATEAGLGVDDAALIYDGPRTPDELWEAGTFADVRSVAVQRSRVMRTRPIFREWSLQVDVELYSAELTVATIEKWLTIAGATKGICDYRPKFGRFRLVETEVISGALAYA